MPIITHEEDVKIIKIDRDKIVEDRNSILSSSESGDSPIIINMVITGPSAGGMKSYGDCKIITKNEEDGSTAQGNYDVLLAAYYKGNILPEALKLSLKEAFTWLNKNKVKADVVYVTNTNYQLSKIDFINLSLIFQNIMKDYKINSSLWLEYIDQVDINSLTMDATDNKEKKDKKKKKKNKKKGK